MATAGILVMAAATVNMKSIMNMDNMETTAGIIDNRKQKTFKYQIEGFFVLRNLTHCFSFGHHAVPGF
jgi:hypothetical protein